MAPLKDTPRARADAGDGRSLTEAESSRLRELIPVRLRGLVVVWLVQAILTPPAFVLLFDPGPVTLLVQGSPGFAVSALCENVLELLSDGSVSLVFGVSLVLSLSAQLAFLAPVRTNRPVAGPASWDHHPYARIERLIATLGMAWCVGMVMYIVVSCASQSLMTTEGFQTWLACLATGLVVSLVIPIARRRWAAPARVSMLIAASYSLALVIAALGVLWSTVRLLMPESLDDKDAYDLVLISVAACALVWWPVMSVLFLRFVRGPDPASGLSRAAELLFKGTIVEVVLAVPVDVMIRRRTDCYCGEGTFFAFICAWAVGFFALGPVVALLPYSRARRRVLRGRCPRCAYARGGLGPALPCPECGFPPLVSKPSTGAKLSDPPSDAPPAS